MKVSCFKVLLLRAHGGSWRRWRGHGRAPPRAGSALLPDGCAAKGARPQRGRAAFAGTAAGRPLAPRPVMVALLDGTLTLIREFRHIKSRLDSGIFHDTYSRSLKNSTVGSCQDHAESAHTGSLRPFGHDLGMIRLSDFSQRSTVCDVP